MKFKKYLGKVCSVSVISKMAAFVACFLSLFKRTSLEISWRNAYGAPFPDRMHIDVPNEDQYKEIFLIGDVHGCYDELLALLEKANVTKDESLKIFVGDLVNKGPKSREVLDLVRNNKSMISVRGNHDEIVMREYFNSQNPGYEISNKNLWMKELSTENVAFLRQLPYTISIKSINAVVVHAGIVPGVPLKLNNPFHMVTMRNLVERDYFWEGGLQASKSAKEGHPWASMWPGPTHVYFGHDAIRMLQLYPHATGLDTGCVYGNQLTGLFVSGERKGEFVEVNAFQTYRIPGGTKVP